jgi:hypothetical protein
MRTMWPQPAPPCPAHLVATGVRTKMPSASPPCQLLPLLPSQRSAPTRACLHCPSTVMHCMLRLSCPIVLPPCARFLSVSDKLPPPRLASVSASPSVLSHLTTPLFPCTSPGVSVEPRATPQPEGPTSCLLLSSDAINRVDELCLPVTHPLRCSLVPWIVSGGCTIAHGCAPWTPSRRTGNYGSAPPVPRRVLCASPPRLGRRMHAIRSVWASTWAVHTLRMGRAGPDHTPLPLGHAGHTHFTCGSAARDLACGHFSK